MNAISETGSGHPIGPGNSKPLWTAVGVLGAAVVAMAGTMVYMQTSRTSGEPVATTTGTSRNAPETSTAAATRLLANSVDTKAGESIVQQDEVSKPVVTTTKQAQVAPKPAAPKQEKATPPTRMPVTVAQSPANSPVPAGAGADAAGTAAPSVAAPVSPALPVAKAVCTTCGTVVAATPVQQNAAQGSGVGMVAGGVLGGVLGNQVGGGSGKTAATVLGALGGGWAGNEVEKRVKKVTVYDTSVQMENGNTRHFSLAQPVSAGARVTVEGSSLRLADGSLVSPRPAPAPRPQVRSTANDPNQPGG